MMSPSSQYVYCVIAAAEAEVAQRLEAAMPAHERIGGLGIKTIRHADRAVIVSPATPRDLAAMRKDELAKMLLAHQRVIELLMESFIAVMPFRLGTYALSEAEVVEILSKGSSLMGRLFGEIGYKIEIDVVATWDDFAAVLKDVGEEDEEIRTCKKALGDDPQNVSVDTKLKVGMLLKQALDRRRLDIGRQIAEKLAAVSCRQCAHENMDDEMVMNGAFLVELAGRRSFECVLDELDTQFAKTLNFRCVGPLAPYSFYTLELKRIQWPDLDGARRLMGLGAAASAEEIRKAFQHTAQAIHPDHCGQTLAADRSFRELNQARRVVLEYMQACEQTGTQSQFVFDEDHARQNAVLVNLRNGNHHG